MTARLVALSIVAASMLAMLGCQRASRYQAAARSAVPEEKLRAEPAWSWQLPLFAPQTHDVPIIFIPHGHKEWDSLTGYWNNFPPRPAGMRTIHLGQTPLAAATLLAAANQLEALKIKVPLGLPDPTPYIPPANPPTLRKWELGRKIFFAKHLVGGPDSFACATCHVPAFGFSEDRAVTLGGIRNTPSLVNSVYNRHQFWDGRATALEEVLVRTLDDELLPDEKTPRRWPQETHRWGGLVRKLDADLDYRTRFEFDLGVKQPTQDAIAKAVATYLRTILAGDALYDRAEQERRRKNDPELLAQHFALQLDDKATASLKAHGDAKAVIAEKLERGHRLFHAKGCAACHSGPLFTDQDFHNVGIGESVRFRQSGQETGRFPHVPIGLKEARLIGAFRTPTLRGLASTAPYFHDGAAHDLLTVVNYFNQRVSGNRYLAETLRLDAAGHAKKLDMNDEDEIALTLFLRSLSGEPVAGVVAAAPK